jgi:hypothetical protein
VELDVLDLDGVFPCDWRFRQVALHTAGVYGCDFGGESGRAQLKVAFSKLYSTIRTITVDEETSESVTAAVPQ